MSSQLEDLKWVTPTDLRGWIQDSPRKVAVVDVRGGDFGGGHIKGCYNFSSNEFTETLPQLYQRVNEEGIEDVVFHCRSSKNRGTRTTLEFINSIKDLLKSKNNFLKRRMFGY